MNAFYEIMELIFILADSIYIMLFTALLLGVKADLKYKKFWIGIFFIVLNGLTFMLGVFPKQEGIITILGVLTAVIYSIWCLKGQIYIKIIYPIVMFIIIGVVSGIVAIMCPFFMNIPIEDVLSAGTIERVMAGMIAKVCIYIFGIIMYAMLKKEKIELSKKEWALIIIIISAMFIEVLGSVLLLYDSNLKLENQIMIIIMMLLIIAIFNIVYYLIIKISAYNKQLFEESMIRLQLEEKTKTITDIEKNYTDLKILEHDIKHHYTIIHSLLLDNKIDETLEYMQNFMEQNITRTNMPVVPNSSIVNAILSSKFTECKEKGIECSARVTCEIEKNMEMDVCIILANIVDNAIRACEKVENPTMGLEIYRDKNYLNIILDNKIPDSVLSDNPKLNTTQKDKKKHGIGILSVKSTVEKYNGMLDFYEKDDKFIAHAVLKID